MESPQSKNCIFITFDDTYYKYAKICLNSLRVNYPNHPPVKILYTGTDAATVEALSERPNVEVLNYELNESQFDGLNICHLGSAMVYARFVLWTDLLDEFDKILYLDCDTIILQPFPELFEREGLFVVADNGGEPVFNKTKSDSQELLASLANDKLQLEEVNNCMINSGFFILPREYRTKEYLEQLWAISKTYNEYIAFADQSIISIWMHMNNIIASTEYQYNFQTQFIFTNTLKELGSENIKVMHYSGWKPDKNFDELFIPASYVVKVMETFIKYDEVPA